MTDRGPCGLVTCQQKVGEHPRTVIQEKNTAYANGWKETIPNMGLSLANTSAGSHLTPKVHKPQTLVHKSPVSSMDTFLGPTWARPKNWMDSYGLSWLIMDCWKWSTWSIHLQLPKSTNFGTSLDPTKNAATALETFGNDMFCGSRQFLSFQRSPFHFSKKLWAWTPAWTPTCEVRFHSKRHSTSSCWRCQPIPKKLTNV